jgi:hypothetical protein
MQSFLFIALHSRVLKVILRILQFFHMHVTLFDIEFTVVGHAVE